MAQNIGIPFSQSTGGNPILINTTASPGVLIHQSISEADFIYLWLSLTTPVSYTDYIYVILTKGAPGIGYGIDSVIYVPPGKKIQVESGVLLTQSLSLHASISTSSSLTNVNVAASGYVHRRIQ